MVVLPKILEKLINCNFSKIFGFTSIIIAYALSIKQKEERTRPAWWVFRLPAWWVYLSGSLPLFRPIYLVWFCMFFYYFVAN